MELAGLSVACAIVEAYPLPASHRVLVLCGGLFPARRPLPALTQLPPAHSDALSNGPPMPLRAPTHPLPAPPPPMPAFRPGQQRRRRLCGGAAPYGAALPRPQRARPAATTAPDQPPPQLQSSRRRHSSSPAAEAAAVAWAASQQICHGNIGAFCASNPVSLSPLLFLLPHSTLATMSTCATLSPPTNHFTMGWSRSARCVCVGGGGEFLA